MTQVERGLKRRCASCDAPFYDMLRQPIQCPKCGAVYDAAAGKRLSSVPRPPKASRVPASRSAAKAAPVAAEPDAAPAPDEAEVEAEELDDEEQVDGAGAHDEDEEDADEETDEDDAEAAGSR